MTTSADTAASEPIDMKALVSRFLGWPLPQSVAADGCATNNAYQFPRSGTNLLNADEAEAMLRYVLEGLSTAPTTVVSDQAAGEPSWHTELRRIADDYQPEGLQAILALEEMRQALRELIESTACDCGVSCQDKGEGNCRYAAPAGTSPGIDVEFVKNPVHGGFHIRKWSARGELSEGKFVFYATHTPVPGSLSDDQAARIFSCAKEWTDEWCEREISGTGIPPSAGLVDAMFVRTVLSMYRSTAPTTGSAPETDDTFIMGYKVGAKLCGTRDEAQKAIIQGHGSSWEPLYRKNHPKPAASVLTDSKAEQRARELLAEAYAEPVEEGPYPTYAELAKKGYGSFTMCSIRAIKRALLAASMGADKS